MSPGLTLLLLASLSAGDPLASAREAFARQDYGTAEALALDVAAPPAEGAALYLAGLARFRAGRAEAALQLIERAALAADPPARGLWDFNRAACLYELGRYGEAEAAFLEAARREPSVAAAALANAGFAALDAGAVERARALAARARSAAQGAALALVSDLERAAAATTPAVATAATTSTTTTPPSPAAAAAAEHEAGLVAWDLGDGAEARRRFERAAALDPTSARSLIMAGAAAGRQGDLAAARATLQRALAGPLDEADRRLALDHLDAATPGLASRGAGWSGSLRLGGGADGNVLQSGAGGGDRASTATGEVSSALLSAAGGVAWRARLAPDLHLELAWGFDQLAYLASQAEDASLQQHLLGAALERTAGRLRLGLAVTGQLSLAGRRDVRLEQWGAGAGGWAAFDWTDAASTRLDLEWTGRAAPRAEFSYLRGGRLEAVLSQALHAGPALVTLGARARDDRLGTLTQASALLPPAVCDFGCTQRYVIPFAYRSAALTLAIQALVGRRLTLTLSGGYERRRYRDESFLEVVQLDGTLTFDRRLRRDERAFGAAAASLALGEHLSLQLRWDLLRSWSNVARQDAPGPGGCNPLDAACHALDYDDKNYVKQAIGLEAVLGW